MKSGIQKKCPQLHFYRKIESKILLLWYMEFVPKEIESYCLNHTTSENPLLNKINRETHLEVLKPRMLSGHLQGRVLSFFSHMLRPKRILEIGTYTGYSTLCLVEGLSDDGSITTIDINEELKERVDSYVKEAGLTKKINLIVGNALEEIGKIEEEWDLVFIDADKENYIKYYDLVIDSVRNGGVIIADNVLWSGKVIDKSKKDHDTQMIRQFNEYVHSDQRVENVLLPIRDGLMMLRKI